MLFYFGPSLYKDNMEKRPKGILYTFWTFLHIVLIERRTKIKKHTVYIYENIFKSPLFRINIVEEQKKSLHYFSP